MSKVLGPIQLEAKVHCIHPETGGSAKVRYSFSPGQPVDAAAIEKALRVAAEAVTEHGYVLMGPATFFNHVLVKEKTGRIGNFAMPADFDYDAFGLETAEAERPDIEDDDDFEDDDA